MHERRLPTLPLAAVAVPLRKTGLMVLRKWEG